MNTGDVVTGISHNYTSVNVVTETLWSLIFPFVA